MYDPKQPEEFDLKPTVTEQDILERARAENLSLENIASRQKQLKRLILWLVGIGLGLGVVVAIAVLIAIQKLGLARRPYELDTPPVQEQIQDDKVRDLETETQ